MSFLYVNGNRKKILKQVNKIIDALPDTTRHLLRVLNRTTLDSLGCDPRVVLALQPYKGITTVADRVGNDVRLMSGGQHGYAFGYDPTVLVAYGCGVPHDERPAISQTDIMAYVLKMFE